MRQVAVLTCLRMRVVMHDHPAVAIEYSEGGEGIPLIRKKSSNAGQCSREVAQGLRGAVIARKVSHCSKSEEGADAFSDFTSVIRTLERNGDDQSVVDRLCALFSGEPLHSPSRRTSHAMR